MPKNYGDGGGLGNIIIKGSPSGGSSHKGPAGPAHPGSPGGIDYYGTYLGIMQGLQISLTKNAIDFAHHANTQHWSTGEFMYYLRQTAFYHQTFPGIMGPHNELRMSESQYLSDFNSISDRASQMGVNFNRQQFGFAVSKGLKSGTILARLTAISRVKESPLVFAQFEQTLRDKGMLTKQRKVGDMEDFVMGMGDKRWYNVWQEASLRAGAAEAGLRIGSDITRGELHRIAQSLPGFQGETDLAKQFQELAQNIRSIAPLSQLAGMGVNAHDLKVLEFGGPHRDGLTRDEVANRVASVYATLKARTQSPALPNIAATAQGPELLGTAGLSKPPQTTL